MPSRPRLCNEDNATQFIFTSSSYKDNNELVIEHSKHHGRRLELWRLSPQ